METAVGYKRIISAGLIFGAAFLLVPQDGLAADKKEATAKGKKPAVSKTAVVEAVEIDPVEEIRAQLRTGKTAVLARTLQFSSEEQAAKFWPIYRQYQTDFAAINDRRIAIAKDYVSNFEGLDNAKAKDIMTRSLNEASEVVKLRQSYAERMSDEVSPMVAASFLQIEGLLQALIDLELKSTLPLVADRLADERKTQIATTAAK